MTTAISELVPSATISRIGLMHVERYWQKAQLDRARVLPEEIKSKEWMLDNTLLSALGLGLKQTLGFLYMTQPSLKQFENWIIATAGLPSAETIDAFNAVVSGRNNIQPYNALNDTTALSDDDLAHWNREGYVILRNAVPVADCEAVIETMCHHLGINRTDPSTWYRDHSDILEGMASILQHPTLQKVRSTKKIRAAFEQLWGRKDIWLKTDCAGFNPPETDNYRFMGSPLHWDVSLHPRIPFSTQGILYLSDTAAEQGAFSLVPGFQHKINHWLSSLPEGTNPREEALSTLGSDVKKIAANAGDMIIWQQALPHCATPNKSNKPRFVLYINYLPVDREVNPDWK